MKYSLKCLSLLALASCGAAVRFPKSHRQPKDIKAVRTSAKDKYAGYDIPETYVEMPDGLPTAGRGEFIVFEPPFREGSPAPAEVRCVIASVFEHNGGGSRTMSGVVGSLEQPAGDCTITCGVRAESAISCIGNVRPDFLPSTQYELRPVYGTGYHVVKEVPYAVYEEDDSNDSEPPRPRTAGLRGQFTAAAETHRRLADTNDIMDVMVVYTPDALAAVGTVEDMNDLINLAMDESNAIMENSDVNLRLRLVHSMGMTNTAYTDPADMIDVLNLATLYGGANAEFDTEQNLRFEKKADALVIITDSGNYCGIAWLNGNGGTTYQVSVTAYNCATGYYTFLHEIGHNLGATHDLSASPHGEGNDYYSHGYCFDRAEATSCDSTCRRTIMAYTGCRTPVHDCTSCPKTAHFSNPDVLVNGVSIGVVDAIDNARTVDSTAPAAVALQDSLQEGGLIFSVQPKEVDAANPNTQVEIKGWRIGGGSDITQVTLAGVPVSSIVSQTADSVTVVPAAAVSAVTGDVVVYQSGAAESTTLQGVFTYTGTGTGTGGSVTFPRTDISSMACQHYANKDIASGLEYAAGKKWMKKGDLSFFTDVTATKNKLKRGKSSVNVAILDDVTPVFETTADLYQGSDHIKVDYAKLEFRARKQKFRLDFDLTKDNTGEPDIGSETRYVELQILENNGGSDVVQECVRFKVSTEVVS